MPAPPEESLPAIVRTCRVSLVCDIASVVGPRGLAEERMKSGMKRRGKFGIEGRQLKRSDKMSLSECRHCVQGFTGQQRLGISGHDPHLIESA